MASEIQKSAFYLALRNGKAKALGIKLLLFGAENVGKTCVAASLVGDPFEECNSTQGADIQICNTTTWKKISKEEASQRLQDKYLGNLTVCAKSNMTAAETSAKKAELISNQERNLQPSHKEKRLAQIAAEDMLKAKSVKEKGANEVMYSRCGIDVTVIDFAGPKLYHNVHSVFIRKENVIMIVFNASVPLSANVKVRSSTLQKDPMTYSENIHFWMKTVHSICHELGDGFDKTSLLPVIILVATHLDLVEGSVENTKEQIITALEKELRGKPYAQHLAGHREGLLVALRKYCIFLSNKFRDPQTIEKLQSVIVEVAAPILSKEHPLVYLKMERQLLALQKGVITIEEFHSVAYKCGFVADIKSQEFAYAVEHFHHSGTILNFAFTKGLKQLVILSPDWLIKFLSYLLFAHPYKHTGNGRDISFNNLKQRGILLESFLSYMLGSFNDSGVTGYQIQLDEAVYLMKHFGFIAQISPKTKILDDEVKIITEEKGLYIVPSLLPDDEKSYKKLPEKDDKNTRIVYFHFPDQFLPSMLFNQVVAMCLNRNEEKREDLIWLRKGKVKIVLDDKQQYCVNLCEETCSIQLTFLLHKKDSSAQQRYELFCYLQSKLELLMNDFMQASNKPKVYIPCYYKDCHKLHVELQLICNKQYQYCYFKDDYIPDDYYVDLFPKLVEDVDSVTGAKEVDCFTALRNIKENYDEMTYLPINSMLGKLFSKDVITLKEKESIKACSTQSDRMEYLLDYVIIPSLKVDVINKFKGLLKVMKESDDPTLLYMAKKLALENMLKTGLENMLKKLEQAKATNETLKVSFITILFCGSSGVGKTSLLNRLDKKSVDRFHHSTGVAKSKHAICMKTAAVIKSAKGLQWTDLNYDEMIKQLNKCVMDLRFPAPLSDDNTLSSSPFNKPTIVNSKNLNTKEKNVQVEKGEVESEILNDSRKTHSNIAKNDQLDKVITAEPDSVENDIAKADSSNSPALGDVWSVINFLDTGGQPEFVNVLPAVKSFVGLTFIVFNLRKSLDKLVRVEHNVNGNPSFPPYDLNCTNLEFIKHLMVSSKNFNDNNASPLKSIKIKGGENKSKICYVGTHAQNVSEQEMLKADNELSNIAKELGLQEKSWCSPKEPLQQLFPIDFFPDDKEKELLFENFIEVIRERIQNLVQIRDYYKVPITWFIFLLKMQKLCQENNTNYILYKEAVNIWMNGNVDINESRLKLDQTSLEDQLKSNSRHLSDTHDALLFFHFMGMLFYFHEIEELRNFVFVDRQWLFAKLTELVQIKFTGCYNRNKIDAVDLQIFTKEGRLNINIIKSLKIDLQDIQPLQFISLLKYLNIIAPINLEQNEYFMPCVLPSFPIAQNFDSSGTIKHKPLLVKFQNGPMPHGIFCHLIVELFKNLPLNWKPPFESTPNKRYVYNNLVIFPTFSNHAVALFYKTGYLEIQVRHKENQYSVIHCDVLHKINKALQMQVSAEELSYGFYCNCENAQHFAKLTDITSPTGYISCIYDQFKLKEDHLVWFQENKIHNTESQQEITVAGTDISKKVYFKFYQELVNSLPMKDAIFVSLLIKLLPGDLKEQVDSKPTKAEAASHFLDNAIKPALEFESLSILLSAMEKFNSITLNGLANKIRNEIHRNIASSEPDHSASSFPANSEKNIPATASSEPDHSTSSFPANSEKNIPATANLSITSFPNIGESNIPATVNTRPKLLDLYEHITPRYTLKWRAIGTLLGIPCEKLDIIEHDNFYKAEPCCNAMLQWWLRVDPNASWGKFITAIESPAVSSGEAVDKGAGTNNYDTFIKGFLIIAAFVCGLAVIYKVLINLHYSQ